MSNISLSVRPHVTLVGWEEFCATHRPYTIRQVIQVTASLGHGTGKRAKALSLWRTVT